MNRIFLFCLAAVAAVATACSHKPRPVSPSSTPPPLPPEPATQAQEAARDPGVAPPDVAAPPSDAERTPSGLASRVLRPGSGTIRPREDNSVEVHYTGWTTDGKMFDSSVVRGKPIQFPLHGVIPGFSEGLQLMVEGERRRLWIPEDLAYKGRPGAPQGMLVFDVELVRIME